MGHHPDVNKIITWVLIVVALVCIALLFPPVRRFVRPVRIWVWGTWLWFSGFRLGRRAPKFETDSRRVGDSIDNMYENVKSHYLKEAGQNIKNWTSGPQQRLVRRLRTLETQLGAAIDKQKELKERLEKEQENPPRDRPRIKGFIYGVVALLLAAADIAITFMCLQALNYPVIFLLPSALMLGIIGFLAGDYLGKNIEPAQTNPNNEKNQRAIILLGSFSLFYCIVFGTMRFIYTQHDPSVPLVLNMFGSYGFIAVIVGCSVMLGWLHEGITTLEQLSSITARITRIEISLQRCDRQGATMTEAFRAHLLSLESESAIVRSRFRNGFDSAWLGRAPYGVESPHSPLEFDEDMLKNLTWPNPPDEMVTMKVRPKKITDLTRYVEPVSDQQEPIVVIQAAPAPSPPAPAPSPPAPVPQAQPAPLPQAQPTVMRVVPKPAPPSPPISSVLDDRPPVIG